MAAPDAPSITVTTDNTVDALVVHINNAATGDPATHNEIQRRPHAVGHTMADFAYADVDADYFDREAASGVAYRYRVRAVNGDGASAWSNVVQDVSVSYNRWWMRDLNDVANDIEVFIDNNPLDLNHREEQATFSPYGRKYPVVLKDAGVKAVRFSVSIQLMGDEEYERFMYLRSLQTTLLLQSPMPEQWYFVFGSAGQERIHNTASSYRHFVIDLIEVDRPEPEPIA